MGFNEPKGIVDDRQGQLDVLGQTIDASSTYIGLVEKDTGCRGRHSHALYNGVNLMPSSGPLAFLAVVHDSMFHLFNSSCSARFESQHRRIATLL